MTIKSWKNKPSDKAASNKPPAADISPDPKLFTHKVTMKDKRVVWISSPQPDRLSFVSYLSKDHFSKGTADGGSGGLLTNVMELGKELAAAQVVYGQSGGHGKFIPDSKQIVAKATFHLGSRGSAVRVELFRKKFNDVPEPSFGLRVECNPRKLGPGGFMELIDIIANCGPVPVNVGAILSKAIVTRLDVAIDLAGLVPADLVIRSKFEQKTVSYRGADDHLETVQFHREKKPPKVPKKVKALGKLDLKVYDRNRHRASVCKPPKYSMPLTRLEIVMVRFPKKGFGLTDIESLKDQFDHVKVFDRDELYFGDDLMSWRAYVACRQQMSATSTAEVLGLHKLKATPMETNFTKLGHPLPLPSAWDGWTSGLESTGLAWLAQLAAHGAKG